MRQGERVLLLGTMDPWRDAVVPRCEQAGLEVRTNVNPAWRNAAGDLAATSVLLADDLSAIRWADTILWHHGPVGETARVELGLLAATARTNGQTVIVHVDDGLPWRNYAQALCALKGLLWAETLLGAVDVLLEKFSGASRDG